MDLKLEERALIVKFQLPYLGLLRYGIHLLHRFRDWGGRRLHNLLVSLDALFKDDDIDQKFQNVWSFKDFRMERPSNVPQQPNGYDCGVYVIKFMVAPEEVTNPDFVFDSYNERLEVALRLLASDVNSCSDDLASKAEAFCEQRFGNR